MANSKTTVIGTLGEVKFGKELGLKNRGQRFLWTGCSQCGKERWVGLDNEDKPLYNICHSCGISKGHKTRNKRNYRWLDPSGYIQVKVNSDSIFYPMARKSGYVAEHRLVMAKAVGRCLKSYEVVHHINGNRSDNRRDNLELLPSNKDHTVYTMMQRRIVELENKVLVLENENIKLKTTFSVLEG